MCGSMAMALRNAGLTARQGREVQQIHGCAFPGCERRLPAYMAEGSYCVSHSQLTRRMKEQLLRGERSRVDVALDAEKEVK